jgi:DNA-binding response OmpR family regulator
MPTPCLLLVDDEPLMGMILTRILRQTPVEFASRPDAAGAHEFLRQNRPDLILLDVNLPGVSGVELLRQLRAAPRTAGLNVALFCQSGLSADVAAGWRAGADYLVWKDLVGQPDELRQRLSAILAHADGRPPLASLTLPTNVSGQTTQDWAAALERLLSQGAARELGQEVHEQILRRAIDLAFGLEVEGQELARWVFSGQGRLDRRSLPPAVPRRCLGVCFASLTDQLWRLLGTEAARPLATAAQAALDRLLS